MKTAQIRLFSSTATAALLIAFNPTTALAQASADLNIGVNETIAASATLTGGNDQRLTAGVTGSLIGTNVNINLTRDDLLDDIITGVAPATNNLLSASASGNISTAAADLEFAPSTAGDTAAVATLQSVEASVFATSTGDTNSILIANEDGGIRTLTGAAIQDNNDITATATGNSGTSTIEVASGLDLVQATDAQANVRIDALLATNPQIATDADLLVSSAQEVDTATIYGSVQGASTNTAVEALDGATVTIANSDQAASATGNSAANSIVSSDTTAEITASTAVANLQGLLGANIQAASDTSDVVVNTGNVANSTVSLNANSQTASATGSTSTQSLSLNASSITGEGLAATVGDGGGAPSVQLAADADAVVANVQTLGSSDVNSFVNNDEIGISVSNTDSVVNSTLEVDGNNQSAATTGLQTANTLSLTSGAEMSAAGAVASVQVINGELTADTSGNRITNRVNDEDYSVTATSVLTTNNQIDANVTGATATNRLVTTSGTNNLSVSSNAGTVDTNPGAFQPFVIAGQVLTNDQDVSASVISANSANNQISTFLAEDATSSTVRTDSNTVSASATANRADNAISLSFNALTGTISGTGTGVVAALANEQTLDGATDVTARNVGAGGVPILTQIGPDSFDSTVSTSNNRVDATASGNVAVANTVLVDGITITSGSEAAPVVGQNDIAATGSFISASEQSSSADILASQVDSTGVTSNTILTDFGDDIEPSSTVVSDGNVLSAFATANRATNAVQLGTDETALISASGIVANTQDAAGTVSAEIGVLGQDAIPAFTSTNTAGTQTTALNVAGSLITNNGSTVTFTFVAPLTAEEQATLVTAGFQNITSTTADFVGGTTINTAGTLNVTAANGTDALFGTADDTLAFNGFVGASQAGELNNAGVIVEVDGFGGGTIEGSTVSVSGNTIVGEVSGNIGTSSATANATTVSGLSATASEVTTTSVVTTSNSDLSAVNYQGASATLESDVAGTFGIIAEGDDNFGIGDITNSTQTVSNNLQQSFATANRGTNSVELTATSTDADTALASLQVSSGTVSTSSDLDVLANVGATNSTLLIEGNRNQSVANGNVVANSSTLDVTNATSSGAVDAALDTTGTRSADGNAVLSSEQVLTASVTASATTDVFNQDATRSGGNEVIDTSVSISRNATTAQATGNSAGTISGNLTGNRLVMGDADTANMDRTAALLNEQSVTAPLVSATVNQDVAIALTNTSTEPLQTSSLSLDGNSTTALARSNVMTNTLIVDGANIAAGAGTDASFEFDSTGGLIETVDAAFVLGSVQDNAAEVVATTTQSRVEVDLSNASGDVISGSTLSLTNNVSSATALANNVVNSVAVGENSANVDGTAALANSQDNTGAVTATGGSAIAVTFDATGGLDPNGVVSSSITLSGNASASNAVGNQAQNSLTAAGTNVVSGGAVNASIDSDTADVLTADAGNLLLSRQTNSAAIESINNVNSVSIGGSVVEGTGPGLLDGAVASGSTLSVTGNTTEARATANIVLNSSISLGGASTTTADATGLIGNFQLNDAAGAVTAEASTNTAISLNGSNSADAMNSSSAMVENNSTLALARGNVVENVLTAEGTNVTSGVSPASLSANLSPDDGVLNASFGVFNEQVQAAAINATSSNASYAINATSGSGDALNSASVAVAGNSVNATAFGNVATNRVTLASLNGSGNDASAAIFNGQLNSGSVTSSVLGATIGTFAAGGFETASVGVSGNTISATAVGNFANSTVTRATR
ncbi:beta strand repeat-containing protein [Roseovarius mucosus]|uniref:beta strand repeat-containing protein n=1 Tax=Roseovarius mucosus TaxID=215743 RepID=UPI003BABC559